MREATAALCIGLVMCEALCLADGLDTLIEVGKGQAQIKKAYEEETNAVVRVKKAVDRGDFEKGQGKAEIARRYGEPVIVTTESGGIREAWVYKDPSDSFFKGTKVYLFFDAGGILDEIRVTNGGGGGREGSAR